MRNKRIQRIINRAALTSTMLFALNGLMVAANAATQQASSSNAALAAEVASLRKEVQALETNHQLSSADYFQPLDNEAQVLLKEKRSDLLFLGTPVGSAPSLGMESSFSGSNLIVNASSINEDLFLLELRETLVQALKAQKLPPPQSSAIFFSGDVLGLVTAAKPYAGARTTNIDLAGAELDVMASINPWAFAFMNLTYDNSPPTTGTLISNSRFFLSKGFVTVGNLGEFPFYASLGQMYLPFGHYSTWMVTTPPIRTLARLHERAIVAGYYQPIRNNQATVGAQLFAYRGDSVVNSGNTYVNEGGVNVSYGFNPPGANTWNGQIGMSIASNMADSEGMQTTGAALTSASGAATFGGFSQATGAENLVHRVPATSVYMNAGYKGYSISGEFITALRRFAAVDMVFNNKGALPSGEQVEAGYNFSWKNWPTTVSGFYGQTQQALALNLPKQSYGAVLNTSFWKNTVESVEYRHDRNYSAAFATNTTGNASLLNIPGLGQDANTVSLQVAYYF